MKLEQFFKQNFVDSVPCTFDYGNQSVKSLFGPIQRSNAADGEGYEAYERVLQLPDENFELVWLSISMKHALNGGWNCRV